MSQSPSLPLGGGELQRKRTNNNQVAPVQTGDMKGAELEMGTNVSPGPRGQAILWKGIGKASPGISDSLGSGSMGEVSTVRDNIQGQ